MLKRYYPLIALLIIVAACNKDKLETKPSIKITNYNAKALPNDQDFIITIEYSDKEGDLGGGKLVYIRDRLNFLPPTIDKADTVPYDIPDFPKAQRGEFELRINADFLNERTGSNPENPDLNNDTVRFKIFVTDLAQNSSDTIVTEPLVQLEPR